MPAPFLSPYLLPVLLLIGSNIFMTTAWYWRLRFKEVPLFTVILIKLGIGLRRILPGGPATRYGSAVYTPAQLKIIPDVITLLVFAFFHRLPEARYQPRHGIGFALIGAGAFFVFRGPL